MPEQCESRRDSHGEGWHLKCARSNADPHDGVVLMQIAQDHAASRYPQNIAFQHRSGGKIHSYSWVSPRCSEINLWRYPQQDYQEGHLTPGGASVMNLTRFFATTSVSLPCSHSAFVSTPMIRADAEIIIEMFAAFFHTDQGTFDLIEVHK